MPAPASEDPARTFGHPIPNTPDKGHASRPGMRAATSIQSMRVQSAYLKPCTTKVGCLPAAPGHPLSQELCLTSTATLRTLAQDCLLILDCSSTWVAPRRAARGVAGSSLCQAWYGPASLQRRAGRTQDICGQVEHLLDAEEG